MLLHIVSSVLFFCSLAGAFLLMNSIFRLTDSRGDVVTMKTIDNVLSEMRAESSAGSRGKRNIKEQKKCTRTKGIMSHQCTLIRCV